MISQSELLADYERDAKVETVISGSRRITDFAIVEAAIRASGFTVTKVIEGGQRTLDMTREPIGGVDYLAYLWALRNRIPHQRVDAKWQIHGRAAGPIRNREMAKIGKQLIAVPDPESTGTVDMIQAAREAGFKPEQIYVHYDPELFPEGPTGCLDDGNELSIALRELSGREAKCQRRPWPCRYRDARQCAHDTMLGAECPKVCDCVCH